MKHKTLYNATMLHLNLDQTKVDTVHNLTNNIFWYTLVYMGEYLMLHKK